MKRIVKYSALALAAIGSLLSATAARAGQTVDLSNPAVTSGVINGAIYAVDTTHPAGTGIFARGTDGVFQTVQMKNGEQGYNTSGGEVMNTKRTPQWNHNITFGSCKTVVVNQKFYIVFLLDINEQSATKKHLLSLDDVKIFTSATPSITDPSLTGTGGLLTDPRLTLRYALDTVANDPTSYCLLDYLRSGSGSGTADMALLVPLEKFGNTKLTDFVYLYTRYGKDVKGACAGAGFEEWTQGGAGVPLEECIVEIPSVPDQNALNPRITEIVQANFPVSFVSVTLSNVPAGFSIENGVPCFGWCVDSFFPITPGVLYQPVLYSSIVPADLAALGISQTTANKLNYLLNHKPANANASDIQEAIFQFLGGGGTGEQLLLNGTLGFGFAIPNAAIVAAIVANVNANGANFTPGSGEITAVFLDAPAALNNGVVVQRLMIEVICE